MKRRSFLYHTAFEATALSLLPMMSACMSNSTGERSEPDMPGADELPSKKALLISLAQWSLHRQIEKNETKPIEFASVAKETYGIEAVEYVNQFYSEYAENEAFWIGMKERADGVGVKSLLIMVDNEGDLGAANDADRLLAVDNHKKWVHAAKLMNCHSIRVNAFGAEDESTFREALADGMGKLAEYAAQEEINVLIENHGLFSSNAALIADVIQTSQPAQFWDLSRFWQLVSERQMGKYDDSM